MFRRREHREQAEVRASAGARARVAALGGFPGDSGGGGAADGDVGVQVRGEYDAAPGRGVGEPTDVPTHEPIVHESDGDASGGEADIDADRARSGWVPDRRAPAPGRGRAWAARLTTAGPWGELAEKWVPEQLRGARVDPKRRGAVLLSAVAAIAAVAAALGVWWSRPQPAPVPAASGAVSAAASDLSATPLSGAGSSDSRDGVAGQTAAGTPDALEPDAETADHARAPVSRRVGSAAAVESSVSAPSDTIVVSVTGNVRHPGVVAISADARVADAIAAAGGAMDDSDLTGLNLAARLEDGSSVVVVGSGGSAVTTDAAGKGGDSPAGVDARINLNSADTTALETLPGIGPVTAAAIIAYRTEHGPFADLAQLQEVSGIGPATFARLEPHVTL